MRKQKKGRKLKRESRQRRVLLLHLAGSLILKEKIKTTEAKAKETRVFVEKSITVAKKGTIAARRLLLKKFPPKIVKKLVDDLGKKFKERKGGYTRIIKTSPRFGDAAKMAIIELVK